MKSTGTAYLFFLLLGSHYAYLGQWGKQILFWFTVGGFGIWALIDLFTIGGKVESYNTKVELKEIRTATMANAVANKSKD